MHITIKYNQGIRENIIALINSIEKGETPDTSVFDTIKNHFQTPYTTGNCGTTKVYTHKEFAQELATLLTTNPKDMERLFDIALGSEVVRVCKETVEVKRFYWSD